MQKPRIIALALISIMLSSSSVSVADGYTIWLDTREINLTNVQNTDQRFYNINLNDGLAVSVSQKNYNGEPFPYKIKLYDSASATIYQVDQANDKQLHSETIYVNLVDAIDGNSSDFGNGDESRLVFIKHADERKALWERIFPLDRIRNNVKSFYKIIQNDHSLSYIQLDEIGSPNNDNSLKQTPIDETALEQMSEFEKFVAKSLYTAEQIDYHSNNLLDINKFVGKAGYVSDQLTIYAQRYTDPEKFIGKSGYVAAQLAIHAQHYSDPEKFIGKSKFVGEQISTQVYPVFDPNQPTLLVLLLPLAGIVIIRYENERIRFYNIQKFVSYVFIVILISSSIIGPFSYSVALWGNAYAQEDPLGETVGPPDDPPIEYQIAEVIEEVIEEIVPEPPPIPEEHPVEEHPVEEPIPESVIEELPPVIEEPPVEIVTNVTISEPIVNVTTTEPIVNVTTVEPIVNVTTTEPIENVTMAEPIVNDTTTEPVIEQTEPEQSGEQHTIPFDEHLILSNEIIISPESNIPSFNHVLSFNETILLNYNSTLSHNNNTVVERIPDYHTIILNETMILNGTVTASGIPLNHSVTLPESFTFTDNVYTKLNGTVQTDLFTGITFADDLSLLLNNQTVAPPQPEDLLHKLFSGSTIFDFISINFTDNTSLPNATDSWQFENDTDNADLVGDATIDQTEGINGTSLLLDGDQDYAQTNSTNSTTYIEDMSIAAWVKPNYTNGSPEFTVASKGSSFALTINNILEPEHIAKFSIFDGIKWTTVESTETIPDDSWTHLTARFNKTGIELYVNGTLQGTVLHEGVQFVSERGQIELKTLNEITSYHDIVIGAMLSTSSDSRPYNMFSGMIDGVELFDERLEPDDIIRLYESTVPIKAPPPPPEPIGIPAPSLRYRVIKGNGTLPASIAAQDLNVDLTKLTVSTWIKPNFTNGSPEFTVVGKENSFVLSLNKMLTPEQVAKFSVYDGVQWHTVTGNATINGWTHVAAVVNGSTVSLYVNGTLDGYLDTGPPITVGSTSNVTLGVYENNLRGEAKQSNYYSGEIDAVTVWEYSMVDREVQEEFESVVDSLLIDQASTLQLIFNEILSLQENEGLHDNDVKASEDLEFIDSIQIKLNEKWIDYSQDDLQFIDNLTVLLTNQTVYYSGITNHTVSFIENLTLLDTVTDVPQVNFTLLPEGLLFSDKVLLQINDTFVLNLPENLLFAEEDTIFLNNETVPEFVPTNRSSNLVHSEIEIGQPVTWTQTVMVNGTDDLQNILLEIPADAQKIQVEKIENGSSIEISQNQTQVIYPEIEPMKNEFDIPHLKEMLIDKIAQKHNASHVVPLDYAELKDVKKVKQKDKPTIALLINETATQITNTTQIILENQTEKEYKIQYETPAPYTTETEIYSEDKFQKNVTVGHDSTLHYTNVRSYSDIPEDLAEHNVDFKLHWMINGSKIDVTNDLRFNVTFVDTNGNGVVDQMTWIVPQLSEQEFEIEAEIIIINVHSTPIVGGNWTVFFNTNGTADLIIKGVSGTTFGTSLPDDLEFLELNNGTHTLTPEINLTANTITYHNYTANNSTGFEASRVITPGGHHLMFQFGNDTGYAHNNAVYWNDNHDSNDISAYSQISGDWALYDEGTTARGKSVNVTDNSDTIFYVTNLNVGGSFTVNATIKPVDNDATGIAFRVNTADADNFYSCSATGDGAFNGGVWRHTNDVADAPTAELAGSAVSYTTDVYYNVTITVNEEANTIRCAWEQITGGGAGTILFDVTATDDDVGPQSGSIGYWTSSMDNMWGDLLYAAALDIPADAFIQPDAAAPGMNVQVQFIGGNFSANSIVTTDSQDIVVGPVVVTDRTGDVVTGNFDGQVLSTIFFIDEQASAQTVTVTIDGVELTNKFEIIPITGSLVGSGDYSGAGAGIYVLGDNNGNNGNRTVGGTIVLDSLIVPNGVTLNINVTDLDLTKAGNQGYLPAVILVDGPIDIQNGGIINASGFDGEQGADNAGASPGGGGGHGGPGGGGGGAAGSNLDNTLNPGGDGFSGGGGGAQEDDVSNPGSDGGTGTGGVGGTGTNAAGGDGGGALYGNKTLAGIGGDANGNQGSSGAGGSGDPFGSQATAGDEAVELNPGRGAGSGAGTSGKSQGGGGAGHGTAGDDGIEATEGGDANEWGRGGFEAGNDHLVPLSGGSGGGGGSPDDGSDDRQGGGAGGGGGALLIYSTGNMTIAGDIYVDGGDGAHAGTGANSRSGGGGAGSGGAIVLQSTNVISTNGLLNATGGKGGVGYQGNVNGGYGGDGRIRVDGIPAGDATIDGTINSGGAAANSPTEFVGPAITNITNTKVTGTAGANALITGWVTNGTHFHTSKVRADANGDFELHVSYFNGTNFITVGQNSTSSITVLSSAATAIAYEVDAALLPSFTDITVSSGVPPTPETGGLNTLGGSVVFLDANNDGFMDVYMNEDDNGNTNDTMIINNGDNTFDTESGAPLAGDGRGAGAGDHDNDGNVDLIVGHDTNFYENDGTATWTLTDLGDPNPEALMFVDIDGDADLDIWSPGENAMWFRNDGSATFVAQTLMPGVGIDPTTNGEGASAADVNNDGYLDLIWSRSSTDNEIWLNNGYLPTKYFRETDINGGANITGLPDGGVGVSDHENMEWAWGDYDNDGDLDVFISGADNEGLYQNDGSGGFTDVTASAQISLVDPDGATWGDYNNDGYLDLLLANATETSKLYRNNGDLTFNDTTASAGFNNIDDIGKTVGFFDSDNDGDLDVISNNPLNLWRNNLYHNTPDLTDNVNASIKIYAFGNGTNSGGDVGSPKTPIGAQISLKNTTDSSLIAYREIIPSQNQLAPPHAQHFGGIDPDATYDIEVLFPSQALITLKQCTPSVDIPRIFNVTYGTYTVPLAFNVTEPEKSNEVLFCVIPRNTSDSSSIEDSITWTLTRFIADETAAIEDIVYKAPVTMVISDEAAVQDTLRAHTTKPMFDSATVDDDIFRIGMRMLDEVFPVEDIIYQAPTTFRPKDTATVQDTISYTVTMRFDDSVTTQDDIFRIGMRMLDEAFPVEDIVYKAPVTMVISDEAAVQDNITWTFIKRFNDEVSVEDIITWVLIRRIFDETAAIEDIVYKAPVTMVISDEAAVQDTLRATPIMRMFDSATVEDILNIVDVVRLRDEINFIEDILYKAPVTMVISDEAAVQDTLSAHTTKPMFDSATVDDILIPRPITSISDSATIGDSIIVHVTMRPKDVVLVQDSLGANTTKPIFDSITVDDILRLVYIMRIQDETAAVEDILYKAPVTMVISDEAAVQDRIIVTYIMRSSDVVTVDDFIQAVQVTRIIDSAIVDDRISIHVTSRFGDTVLTQDILSTMPIMRMLDVVSVDDYIQAVQVTRIIDSAIVDDRISIHVTSRFSDRVSVDDRIFSNPTMIIRDTASVDDLIKFTVTRKVNDDLATVSDSITFTAFMRMRDLVITNGDKIDRLGSLTFTVNGENANVDDSITFTMFSRPKDVVTIQDVIGKRTTIQILDTIGVSDYLVLIAFPPVFEIGLIDDSITFTMFSRPKDVITVQEVLRVETTKRGILDTAAVEDRIIPLIIIALKDSAAVTDSIVTFVIMRPKDVVTVEDLITWTLIRRFGDTVLVDDYLVAVIRVMLLDVSTIEDRISKHVTSRFNDTVLAQDILSTMPIMRMLDVVSVDDFIRVIPRIPIKDTATVEDRISIHVTSRFNDTVLAQDILSTMPIMRMLDVVSVDDYIQAVQIKRVKEVATVDDLITWTLTRRFSDSVLVDDIITTMPIIRIRDDVSVQDTLRSIPIIPVSDSATLSDVITKTVFARPKDTVFVQDDITKIVFSFQGDLALVSDTLKAITIKKMLDSASVSDNLGKTIFARPKDTVFVQDDITKIVFSFQGDLALVSDTLKAITIKKLYDSASVSDILTKTMISRPKDTVLVQDDIVKVAFFLQADLVLIDDTIRVTPIKRMSDTASVSDTLIKTVFSRPKDIVSVQDDILKIVFSFQGDLALVSDTLKAITIKKLYDSASVSDTLIKTVFSRPKDIVSIQDDIVKVVFFIQSSDVLIDDTIRVTPIKRMFESASVSDTLIKTVFSRPKDTVSIQDVLFKTAFMIMRDTMSIQDTLRPITIMRISDAATVSDTLIKTVFSRPKDTISVQDDIRIIDIIFKTEEAFVTDKIILVIVKKPKDQASVSDVISKTVFYRINDTALTEDILKKLITVRIRDETAAVEDLIKIAPVTFRPMEAGLVQDSIRKIVTYRYSDTALVDDIPRYTAMMYTRDDASVDDSITWVLSRGVVDESAIQDRITWTLTRVFGDEAAVQDRITWTLTRAFVDEATIQDNITWTFVKRFNDEVSVKDIPNWTLTKPFRDTATVGDASITPMGSINIETRDIGILHPAFTEYLVLPEPYTGLGTAVFDDGLGTDYDNVGSNGQISIFPVPFGTYRINQTIAPAGYSSLINFTFVTVDGADLNATALFEVFDKTDDPADLLLTNSDILDFEKYSDITNLINNQRLSRVDAGIETSITAVNQLPEPLFIGANNPAGTIAAAETQPTLLYKNSAALMTNETPEEIRDFFKLSPYDAGNFTETTFVGVFTATDESPVFGQYLSTIPHDKFNCGQRYIYDLDETLVPSFGGMTRIDFATNSAGVCPESEDYLTFEIARAPSINSGVPAGVSNLDTLLYVNPQYPFGSFTGDGVDFSSPSNVASGQFKLITPFPETGDIDDLIVYIFDTDWTTEGVSIFSKQTILVGPNAGMVELTISVTHLEKLLVTGAQIPEIPSRSPTGTGLIGVGPSAGAAGGGGGTTPTAKVQRIEYDVCNENISRILVSHDSTSPPKVQLLTTKAGIIDATLVSDQPFADQNQITLFDKYLFEAPLTQGESIFTVFAIDRNSNVQRTLVEVDGCTGTLILVDDQIILPDIFDFKYQIENNTSIRVDTPEHHYVDQTTDLEVSAIINSPIVPLRKADLYVKTLGGIEQTVIPMSITPIDMPNLNSLSTISSTIPDVLVNGPAIEFWIRLVTEEGVVQESKHSIVGVKPFTHTEASSAEMDTVTIKAQGTTLRPTAYLTNEAEIPVYGTVTLVADGEKVSSKPVLLTPGQNRIALEWSIPKSDDSRMYSIQTMLEVYDKSYITSEATLNTFVRTQIIPITAQSHIEPITDEIGNTIARPAMLYASNPEDGRFKVIAPDGTCVIGAGCLVEESTLNHRGAIDSVIVDGQIFRVRYSGADNALERFSITSLDSVLGEWRIEIEYTESPFVASAIHDVPIKVKYRAERSPLVTVTSE